MTDQPEALCVAQVLESDWRVNLVIAVAPAAARLLREQHKEIARLREQLRLVNIDASNEAAENEALRRDAELGRWIREETPPIEEIAARVDGMEDET